MLSQEVIINLTPTGMIPTKAMSPHVPVTPREIIEDVDRCAKLGAGIVHVHARDADGTPTYRKEVYREIVLGIRECHPDLVVGVSCSGRNHSELEKRADVLSLDADAKPDLASLTLSSLNFNKTASVNAPGTVKALARIMGERDIKPELEIFDLGMANYARYLLRKDLLQPPCYFNLVLGNVACAQASPLHTGLLLSELPPDSVATIGGVGDYQQQANLLGVLFADGVRIGLEDSIYLGPSRKRLATNVDLLERLLTHIAALGRRVATPQAVRKRLGLPHAAYEGLSE